MQKTKLGTLIDIFDFQRIPLSSIEREQRQGPYPYYGASGIIDYIDNYIFDGDYLLVAEDGENLNSRNLPVAFFANGKFWVNNHAHIIKGKKSILIDEYLKYWFDYNDISGYITGTAQPKLSQSNLKNIEVIIPSYPYQTKIVNLCKNYDNLIGINNKRIKTLEEIAQKLYTEWFVNFRFPGYEKVKMVDSELGKIPENWKIKQLGDLIEIKKGKNITRSTVTEGDIPVVAAGVEPAYYHNTSNVVGPVVTISASGANAGFVNLYYKNIWASDCSFISSNSTKYIYFYYLTLKNKQNEITGMQKGTAQPHVYPEDLKRYKVLYPEDSTIFLFESVMTPIYKLRCNLKDRSGILTRTRDLLIPKLISGEVDVSGLDL